MNDTPPKYGQWEEKSLLPMGLNVVMMFEPMGADAVNTPGGVIPAEAQKPCEGDNAYSIQPLQGCPAHFSSESFFAAVNEPARIT